jgi:hypothetical protein
MGITFVFFFSGSWMGKVLLALDQHRYLVSLDWRRQVK